jgi:hypothetical protein
MYLGIINLWLAWLEADLGSFKRPSQAVHAPYIQA